MGAYSNYKYSPKSIIAKARDGFGAPRQKTKNWFAGNSELIKDTNSNYILHHKLAKLA